MNIPTTDDYVIMLLATALCVGAMFVTLFWFFRRLHNIEQDTWGEQGHESLRAIVKDAIYRVRHRARKG